MRKFTILQNSYLRQNTRALYHTEYVGFQNPGNPDYINTLKNTFNSTSDFVLNEAVQMLKDVLMEDLPQIPNLVNLNTMTVCVVPRAKSRHLPKQQLFRTTVGNVLSQMYDYQDGTGFITRHTNTRTTHLRKPMKNFINDGKLPYPGITEDTCRISRDVAGRDILLIDDIYTKSVNIDEDAIQALLNNGARSVVFYAVGHTRR